MTAWTGIFAPRGLPTARLRALNEAIVASVRDAEYVDWIALLGSEVVAGSPAELASFLRGDVDRWARIVREIGVKLD